MPVIEIKNLTKHFGKVKAVDGISFAVERARFSDFGAQWRRKNHYHPMYDGFYPSTGNKQSSIFCSHFWAIRNF